MKRNLLALGVAGVIAGLPIAAVLADGGRSDDAPTAPQQSVVDQPVAEPSTTAPTTPTMTPPPPVPVPNSGDDDDDDDDHDDDDDDDDHDDDDD